MLLQADPDQRFSALVMLAGNEYTADDTTAFECWGQFCSNLPGVLEDPREGVRNLAASIIASIVEALKSITTSQVGSKSPEL